MFKALNYCKIIVVDSKKRCTFATGSPTQPAPFESPRAGTQQGY